MADLSKSYGRPAPPDSPFELYARPFMRISGVLLLLLAGGGPLLLRPLQPLRYLQFQVLGRPRCSAIYNAENVMADLSKSYGRPAPTDSPFELYAWLFMRISGVLLLLLAVGHLCIMHLFNHIDTINYEFVAGRWCRYG